MMPIDITTFQEGDEAEVRRVHLAAFAPWLDELGPLYGWNPVSEAEVAAWHDPPLKEVWVARDDDSQAIVAYARCTREREDDAWVLWLEPPMEGLSQSSLAVDPARQRQGVGRTFLETLLRRYRMCNVRHLVTLAYSDNATATAMCESIGLHHGTAHAPDSVLAAYDLSRPLPTAPEIPDITVRRISDGDVGGMRRVFGEARSSLYGASPTQEQIQMWLNSGWGETILVAEDAGRVVGCMEHTPLGRIGIPGVLPGYQGRGIGSLLMCRLLEAMREKGLPLALSDTGYAEDKMGAVYLYRRLGFDCSRELWAWSRTYEDLPQAP